MNIPLYYTGAVADRAALLRHDEEWLRAALAAPSSLFAPLWRNRNLLRGGDSPSTVLWTGREATPYLAEPPLFLGVQENDSAVFAIDLSHLHEEQAKRIAGGGDFLDLWEAGPVLPERDAALLAYARALAFWHRRNRFCSRCGQPSQPIHGGHLRRCVSPDCATDHFPRTDPAVIMLVEGRLGSEPVCLLGRQARWTPGMYSTLAGFVEPGESLEEAVAREVYEETGISVEGAAYRGSQPWPFPASVMLGFHARAKEVDLTVNRDELEDARWFTRDDLHAFSEKGLSLPRRHTIAYRLIAEWLGDTA